MTLLRDEDGAYVESPVHGWFELSHASWLTLPRVLMEAMPLDWQKKMVALLEEYQAAFPNQSDIGTRVQITRDGRLTKMPEWLTSYRRPDIAAINSLRGDD
jgi:hypothetical protein